MHIRISDQNKDKCLFTTMTIIGAQLNERSHEAVSVLWETLEEQDALWQGDKVLMLDADNIVHTVSLDDRQFTHNAINYAVLQNFGKYEALVYVHPYRTLGGYGVNAAICPK